MSNQTVLRVEAREEYGKAAARRVRREGKVPTNLYGQGVEPVALQADRHELEQLIGNISVGSTLIDLDMGGGPRQRVLIREIQRHPYRPQILHVDFLAIKAGEKIKVGVLIRVEGTPSGVRNSGGILQQSRYELEVECLPREIPDSFVIDVSELEIGDSVHVGDVDTGGLIPLEDEGLTVCTILAPKVVAVEEEEKVEELEEELEPEVITARAEAEEERDAEGKSE
jgi:large subunit ribosomal protein L25